MRFRLLVTTTIMVTLLLSGCSGELKFGPGMQDFDRELPNDFRLFKASAHEMMIVPKEGTFEENNTIPSKVIKLGWNKNYIIAVQHPLKENPEKNNGVEIPDKKVENYWIIKPSKEIVGPLSKKEFTRYKDKFELGDLELKKISEYD
ncbi:MULTISPECIES: DUF3997 domain-containing protein [Pontibacillus]|uniref:DUF3997 domain-containing protein n=1 Tax=Pontibacillus chungwhensis TaxID=265426 RepID=A0ABY8UZG4_9BACI|nr:MULTISPECIES: DUF3997 domain-containing protein [Pontibacillus]MCD5324629.1 DUF3997 domain-containing protein [Pontibacillus sp. HN14]WIF99077.1 DUF3997 domain-containing protein [Pontibacillus chungwhensis]